MEALGGQGIYKALSSLSKRVNIGVNVNFRQFVGLLGFFSFFVVFFNYF